jgi:hypothetical protein
MNDAYAKLNADQQVFVDAQHAIYAIMAQAEGGDMPGHKSRSMDDVAKGLAMALAMVVEGNRGVRTRRDIRQTAESFSKMVQWFAESLREQAEQSGTHYLDHVISAVTPAASSDRNR